MAGVERFRHDKDDTLFGRRGVGQQNGGCACDPDLSGKVNASALPVPKILTEGRAWDRFSEYRIVRQPELRCRRILIGVRGVEGVDEVVLGGDDHDVARGGASGDLGPGNDQRLSVNIAFDEPEAELSELVLLLDIHLLDRQVGLLQVYTRAACVLMLSENIDLGRRLTGRNQCEDSWQAKRECASKKSNEHHHSSLLDHGP